jgi:hypothetical protein
VLLDSVPHPAALSCLACEEPRASGRPRWESCHREETGLFADMYPHTLIAPWEDNYTVLKNEPLLWLYD